MAPPCQRLIARITTLEPDGAPRDMPPPPHSALAAQRATRPAFVPAAPRAGVGPPPDATVGRELLAPRLLAPPSPPMRRWGRRLAPLIVSPSPWARLSRYLLVTPLGHVTHACVPFQLYLYAIFHRSRVTRTVHRVGMPLINAAVLAWLVALFPALGAAATLAYVVDGLARARHPLIAPARGPFLASTVAIASGAAAWGAAGAHGAWWVFLVAAACEAISHGAEPAAPPRTNGSADWIPMRRWFLPRPPASRPRALAFALASSTLSFFSGVCNELWGAWRLWPYALALPRIEAGAGGPTGARFREVLSEALASGNPAIDAMGVGGARLADASYPATEATSLRA